MTASTLRVAVIGAGLAGLTAARALADAGAAVTVFEKSRGIGGRLATRRTRTGLDFDHGAPAVQPCPGPFAAFLDAARAAGCAADWRGQVVGLPGMGGLCAGLAAGLDIRFGVEAAPVARAPGGWRVADGTFDRVICTAPAPQTARLCAAVAAVAEAAAAAAMSPCWALMAAWDRSPPAPAAPPAPFAGLWRMADKPGRAALPDRWVAHASAGWTLDNLERDAEPVCAGLLAALAPALGVEPGAAVYATAHRWRFARVAAPVGAPRLSAEGVIAAGDWLLGDGAGCAHASGLAAAAACL